MITTIDSAKDAVAERLSPTLDSVQEQVRQARRVITHGRHAAEDFVAETELNVRRRPLSSIALAGAVGALAGCLFGLLLGSQTRRRRLDA
jgi:ElaB/YqjD/DUF883 family membrane-anchored ribosome-binding protein